MSPLKLKYFNLNSSDKGLWKSDSYQLSYVYTYIHIYIYTDTHTHTHTHTHFSKLTLSRSNISRYKFKGRQHLFCLLMSCVLTEVLYIYAFGRNFYPKLLLHSRCTLCKFMYSLGFKPMTLVLLAPGSTFRMAWMCGSDTNLSCDCIHRSVIGWKTPVNGKKRAHIPLSAFFFTRMKTRLLGI